jgi:hypothetical protein
LKSAVVIAESYRTWGPHLHMEDIEAVSPSVHLSEEAAMAILGVKHTAINLHT